MEKRRIAILGSTGSIGKQTLDVIRQHRDLFEVELLTANNSSDLLITQAIEFDCNTVVICNGNKYKEVSEALQKYDIKVFAGIKSVCDLVSGDNIDIVVAAMVGFSGLAPTIEAVKAGKAIALANKETLVAAGSIIMDLALKYHSPILPVDSEHSAIFQCLLGAGNNKISKIHLTASGGPFRTMDRPEIAKATKDMALKHPNWNMGAKITIDSATMMNKGFEMIEAKWLFDVAPENINIVVHPESIIHSMIEYEDGAIIAQMGHPDMRESIQFAINFPNRLPLNNKKINFSELGKLSFFAPDNEKFPALGLSFKAIAKGGNIPCALNAANEAAVAAFLKDKIHFYDISDIVEKCINDISYIEKPTIEEIFETHNNTLALADKLIDKK